MLLYCIFSWQLLVESCEIIKIALALSPYPYLRLPATLKFGLHGHCARPYYLKLLSLKCPQLLSVYRYRTWQYNLICTRTVNLTLSFIYRTTAFGFLNALCKLAAVLGISIFTSFVGITKAVPIMFASGALAAGSYLALKLPETRGQVLQ